ncbi:MULTISPECIES: transposase family protein [Moorena]|uniref:DDE domain transposase n=2 Tax=Moorena TaxID=1155738 RepID=F4Y2P4_9CYAN|nr:MULTISPECIES: transposase family protein [Moorena]EGJ28888.1 DDE domain transposase [Moorena producens 3L]NEQ12027.1 transposase [Moorena sp. SIO4E2]NER92253.1 transposase [Moorena sp. SIO3A2]OLT68066.1 IS5 family transposase [Moorena producens 3L]
MSYTWNYIQKNPKQTKRLLGINYEQLSQLIEQAKLLHRQHQEKIENQKVRLIKPGGGAGQKLSIEDQIVLTLIYLRHHINFQLLGLQFQVSESKANSTFNYWQSIFREALPASLLEQVKKYEESEDIIQEALTEYELIVDSAEQVRERPSDYNQQKLFYSGKKKNHTFKNQFIVLPKGEDIVDVVVGKPGPKSDINICRESLKKFDDKQRLSGDKAYLGEEQIRTPHKKPRNGELTSQQKKYNKLLSSNRIFVEHVIRLVKIFKIAGERFRLNSNKYSGVILTICGLVRLRTGALVLQVTKASEIAETIEVVYAHSFSAKLTSIAS